MNQRLTLPLLAILLAMFVVADSNVAEAVDVGVGVGVGGGRHDRGGVGVEFYTGDPGYNDFYQDADVAPDVVVDPYVYATPDVDIGFGGWYGGGGGGGDRGDRGGGGGGGHYGSAGRSGGGGGGGGHGGGGHR